MIPLPKLDDLDWQTLVDEARAMIPGLCPEWTNHNPSDPGMTLVELFAWLTELLIYRTNLVPESHQQRFLALLEGPDWTSGPDPQENARATLERLRQRVRAVTPEDFEQLALAVDGVARARCLPGRNLAAAPSRRSRLAPGHVSLVVEPTDGQDPQALLQAVWQDLDPRRLITTRHHVVLPERVPIGVELLIARRSETDADTLQARLVGALKDTFDSQIGGLEGQGWPLGRDVYVSEVLRPLAWAEGVETVIDLDLAAIPTEPSVPGSARPVWNDQGGLVGLALEDHQLPTLSPENLRIVIGDHFVPVRVEIVVALESPTPTNGEDEPSTVAIRRAIAQIFAPLTGPAEDGHRVVRTVEVREAVLVLPEVAAVVSLEIESPPDRHADPVHGPGVELPGGELADLAIEIEILEGATA